MKTPITLAEKIQRVVQGGWEMPEFDDFGVMIFPGDEELLSYRPSALGVWDLDSLEEYLEQPPRDLVDPFNLEQAHSRWGQALIDKAEGIDPRGWPLV